MSTRAKLAAHRTQLIVGAAVIFLGTSGIAAVKAWIPSSTRSAPHAAEAPLEAPLPPAPAGGEPRVGASCAECGVVASRRKIEQAGAGIKGYEITVRMRDGSSRAFIDAYSADWRPGQRLIFIDGAGSLASSRE